MDNKLLDTTWHSILEALSSSALKKLMELPESEINQFNVYRIIEESGINIKELIAEGEIQWKD